MTIGIGLGLSNYTFSTAECYWDWVHMCDDEGVDSLWPVSYTHLRAHET